MERWSGRVALVTGASAGIGAAITRSLVTAGMRVVGCARRLEKLHELKEELKSGPGMFVPIKCDLSREDDILSMFNSIRSNPELKGVDVCINNAGMAKNAPILSGETDHWRTMLEVNILAVSICTREAVKSMKERGVDDGHIFLIGSLSGHRVLPFSTTSFYSATKFALRALTEAIRNELRERKSRIRVTELSPGLVETEFAYQLHSDNPEVAKRLYDNAQCLTAEDLASHLVFALQAPPHVQIHDILVRPTEQVY